MVDVVEMVEEEEKEERVEPAELEEQLLEFTMDIVLYKLEVEEMGVEVAMEEEEVEEMGAIVLISLWLGRMDFSLPTIIRRTSFL